MYVCLLLVLFVSGRGLCDKLITRPEKSYRLWCVVVCCWLIYLIKTIHGMSNIKFKSAAFCSYKIWHMNCLSLRQKRAVIAYDLKMRFDVQKFYWAERKLLLSSLWILHWDDPYRV